MDNQRMILCGSVRRMSYEIVGFPQVAKDLKKLAKEKWHYIQKFKGLYQELAIHPETGSGKPEPFRGNLSGCWLEQVA